MTINKFTQQVETKYLPPIELDGITYNIIREAVLSQGPKPPESLYGVKLEIIYQNDKKDVTTFAFSYNEKSNKGKFVSDAPRGFTDKAQWEGHLDFLTALFLSYWNNGGIRIIKGK